MSAIRARVGELVRLTEQGVYLLVSFRSGTVEGEGCGRQPIDWQEQLAEAGNQRNESFDGFVQKTLRFRFRTICRARLLLALSNDSSIMFADYLICRLRDYFA